MKQQARKYLTIFGVVVILVSFAVMSYITIKKIGIERVLNERKRANDNYVPFNKDVTVEKTNLPIIYINTGHIKRDDFINADVKIVENGSIDFEGKMAIRYRGHASYHSAKKKSYALRPLDDNGDKVNVSLLGMKKNKKYALKANWIDQSMIRESIAYELARKTEVHAPEQRFCEVILNGIYYGVYTLMEQPSRKSLGIKKIEEDLTGGYLLYFARKKESNFIVDYEGSNTITQYPFIIKYPELTEMTEDRKKYLINRLQAMNEAMRDSSSRRYEDYIDVLSFIDYQLSSEFACNTDAYWGSGFLYKNSDDVDSLFRMCLWDGDHAFGMGRSAKYSWYNHWIYEFHESLDMDHRYDWWSILMKNSNYRSKLQVRWKEQRNGVYSDDNVYYVVDSLYNLLTIGGAMERNNQAWEVWDQFTGNNVNLAQHVKYQSDSYMDEVQHIKDWIRLRLEWMDKELLNN